MHAILQCKRPDIVAWLWKKTTKINYCEIIFIPRTFNFVYFVDMAMQLQILTKYLWSIILYNLKSTNSSIHEHVHHHISIKFSASKIKWFPCNGFIYIIYISIRMSVIYIKKLQITMAMLCQGHQFSCSN